MAKTCVASTSENGGGTDHGMQPSQKALPSRASGSRRGVGGRLGGNRVFRVLRRV